MSEWMDSLVDEKLIGVWTSGWIAKLMDCFMNG